MSQTTATDTDDRLAQLLRELRPVGLLQTMLVEQLALAMGRLSQVDAIEDADDPAWVRRHAQVERSFYRALTEFRRFVKADAKAEAAATADAKVPEPAPAASTTTRAARPDPSALLRSFRASAGRGSAAKHRDGRAPARQRDCLAAAIG